MKKEKIVKAIRRITIVGNKNIENSVTEEIIEMPIFIDEKAKTNKEEQLFETRKILIDNKGLEY